MCYNAWCLILLSKWCLIFFVCFVPFLIWKWQVFFGCKQPYAATSVACSQITEISIRLCIRQTREGLNFPLIKSWSKHQLSNCFLPCNLQRPAAALPPMCYKRLWCLSLAWLSSLPHPPLAPIQSALDILPLASPPILLFNPQARLPAEGPRTLKRARAGCLSAGLFAIGSK